MKVNILFLLLLNNFPITMGQLLLLLIFKYELKITIS